MVRPFEEIGTVRNFDEITPQGIPSAPAIRPFEEIKEEKPIGFFEAVGEDIPGKIPTSPSRAIASAELVSAFGRLKSDDYSKIPTVGIAPSPEKALIGDLSGFGYYSAISQIALKQGEAAKRWTPQRQKEYDIETITNYFKDSEEKQRRGYSTGGKVGGMLSDMPAYVIEFMATGGLRGLASEATKKTATKMLRKYAATTAGKAAIGTSGFAVGTGLQAAGMPHRAAQLILSRQAPEHIEIKDDGTVNIIGPVEKPFTSVYKGLLDHYIEIASENAGEFIAPAVSKILKRTPFMGKVLEKIQTKWLSKYKGKTATDFLDKIRTTTGFHGVLGEIGEEYLGDITRAITDVDHFGAGEDANMPQRISAAVKVDTANLPAMAIAFAIPGITTNVVNRQLVNQVNKAEEVQEIYKQELRNAYITQFGKIPTEEFLDYQATVNSELGYENDYGTAKDLETNRKKYNFDTPTPVASMTPKWLLNRQLGLETLLKDVTAGRESLEIEQKDLNGWINGILPKIKKEKGLARLPEILTEEEAKTETLTGAAIRLKSGEMLTGTTHANILRDVQAEGRTITNEEFDVPAGSGFVTNTGRFVSPEEAWGVADGAGQINKNKIAKELVDKKYLIGEGVDFEKGKVSAEGVTHKQLRQIQQNILTIKNAKNLSEEEVAKLAKEKVIEEFGSDPEITLYRGISPERKADPFRADTSSKVGRHWSFTKEVAEGFAGEKGQVYSVKIKASELANINLAQTTGKTAEGGEVRLSAKLQEGATVTQPETTTEPTQPTPEAISKVHILQKKIGKDTNPIHIMRDLLDSYEDAPPFLNENETQIFNKIRELTRYMRERANMVRKRMGLEPIPYTEAYITHWMDSVAREMISQSEKDVDERDLPIHDGFLYKLMKNIPKNVENKTALRRKLHGEMEKYFSKDLGKLLRTMVSFNLRDIYLKEPYEAAWSELQRLRKEQLIPESTFRKAEEFLLYDIRKHKTELDKSFDRLLKKPVDLLNKLLPVKRAIDDPSRQIFGFLNNAQLLSGLALRLKPANRNLGQRLLLTDLYRSQDIAKAQAVAFRLAEMPIVKDPITGEDIKLIDLIRQQDWYKLALSKFTEMNATMSGVVQKSMYLFSKTHIGSQFLSNVDLSAITGYLDWQQMYEQSQNPKSEHYKNMKLYSKKNNVPMHELVTQESDMLWNMREAVRRTQWEYFNTSMPAVYRGSAARAGLKFQSWWMNYFFNHCQAMLNQTLTGRNSLGRLLTPGGRLRAVKGLGTIVAIGKASKVLLKVEMLKYLFLPAPQYLPPIPELVVGLIHYLWADDDKERKRAWGRLKFGLKFWIPFSAFKRDLNKLLSGEYSIADFLFYRPKDKGK